MSAASAARAGRLAAERMMTDLVRIRRVTGSTLNETTGKTTPTYSAVYGGATGLPGRVQSYQPFESTPVAGGQQVTVQRTSLHLPVTATGVAIDDVADVIASATNPSLVGNVYRIAALHEKTNQTSQRLLVDQVTS